MLAFLRLWIWFSFRQLVAHRWRTIAVLLGIALGAAVFTSVRLAVDASLHSFTNSVDILAGKADWVVVRPGGRVPEGVVPTLLKDPAVVTASPILTGYVEPAAEPGQPFLLIGLDPVLDHLLRSWQTGPAQMQGPGRWLDLMARPYSFLVSRKLARQHHWVSGDHVALLQVGHRQSFQLLGTLDPQGLALADAGRIAVTDIATMQEFTGLYGVVDRIDLLLQPHATAADLQRLRRLLPPGVQLVRPGAIKASGRQMIKAYQLNLSVLSFVSLFVGMFLVYSLVALNATSRRHELAVLRSMGASSRTLFLLFLSEGAFFGIIGWLLAIPLGSAMIHQLLGSVSATISHLFVRVQVDRLQLSGWEIPLSFLTTVGISLLAAYQPAYQAMQVSPREAFLAAESAPTRSRTTGKLALAGLLLVALVWPLAQLPGLARVPVFGYIATFFLFAGFSLLSPWFMRFLGRYLPPLLRRVAGQPAYLGGRYIRDAGTRIAISVGALITAMALFVALVIMVHSFRSTVQLWVNQSIRGDLFLQPQMANLNDYRYALPKAVVDKLQSLHREVDLLPYRRIFLQRGRVRYQFEAINFQKFLQHGSFLLLQGKLPAILPQLEHGRGVLVSQVFASQTGLGVGKRFRAEIEGVHLDVPILGIFRDYRTQGGVVYFSLPRFAALSGDPSWSGVRVFFRHLQQDDDSSSLSPTRQAVINEILRFVGRQHAVSVTLGESLRHSILKIFDETFAITTVLLLIALFVAALGITTTLAVLVLERTGQLNTLLAIGADFQQIRTMICWEAVLMVTVGEIMGAGCGFILSYLLIFVINKQSFGWTFLYRVDWSSLLLSLPLILGTALLAALPATRLVFREPPATLLRER